MLVMGYFAARFPKMRLHGLPTPTEDHGIMLRELCQPLSVTPSSGGLATYYEIVTKSVYTPTKEWRPQSTQTVVDVGANIGVFALWAASLVGPDGTVVALEPNPLAYQLLEKNLNGLSQARTYAVACGEDVMALDLHYAEGRLSIGSFYPRQDRTYSVRVPVTPLDDVLADLEGKIDLLKIDVEGYEAPVLRGATKTLARTHRLALEIAGDDLDESRVLIEAAGLRLVSTGDGMWKIPREAALVAHFVRPEPFTAY